MHLRVVQVEPHGTILRQQTANLHQPVPDHGQPDRVFEIVVVVLEGLAGVEGRVDVRQPHATDVLGGELRQFQQAHERIQSIAPDQQVVAASQVRRAGLPHEGGVT